MRDIQFALVREGTSDNGLTGLIRKLLVRAGAPGAIGEPRDYPGTTREKLQKVLDERGPGPDLIFVHRDSDKRDPNDRHAEIIEAATQLGCLEKVVAIVPVRTTEAWLLTDAAEIRAVVGRPTGTTELGIPPLRNIETTAEPKQILKTACMTASEKTGRRLQAISRQFEQHRALLLERLDIEGSVTQLASWQQFVADLNAAATKLLSSTTES